MSMPHFGPTSMRFMPPRIEIGYRLLSLGEKIKSSDECWDNRPRWGPVSGIWNGKPLQSFHFAHRRKTKK
jgi:hypothetical protein